MTDYAWEETQTDNIIDAQAKAAALPEISTAEAVAVCERISRQLEAALNPANVKPTDEQRERIKARIMEQCECAAIGVKPCGMCEG